ncbi:MAG: hypothetical protein Q6L60_11260 [Thermostichus sp. HHBFW_bins_43]
MRSNVNLEKIKILMQALGREAQSSGCIYFTGGTSALIMGWRESTIDVDIRLDPEPEGIFQAIAKLKNQLDINVELASPQDFLPPLPGWRERSLFISKCGQVSFMILLLRLSPSSPEGSIATLKMSRPCTAISFFL